MPCDILSKDIKTYFVCNHKDTALQSSDDRTAGRGELLISYKVIFFFKVKRSQAIEGCQHQQEADT